MKRKKREKYKKSLVIISTIIVIFLLLFYFINDNTKNNIIFNSLKNLTADISNIIPKKNNNNSEIIKEINKDYENEINNLKKILDLNTLNSDKKFINSTVIKRSTKYWYDIITIDKGKKDGIKKGYAVINDRGLIGKVVNVTNNSSDVKLLVSSSREDYISASFSYDNNIYYGLIDKYDIRTGELTLIDVIGEFDTDKLKGINITTSGLSDSFTSGLLIGKIKDVSKDTYGLSYIIKLTPSVDFNNINIVSIIKGDK